MADEDPLILDFRNGRVLDGADLDEYDLSGLDDGPVNWDDIDLEDAFDLPPVLPPVRLPEEAELAAQARRSALLADLRALAGEVRKTTVQTAAVNPVLLGLAEEAELVESDGEDLAPGEDAGWLDDLADDSDVLDAWEYAFAVVLDTTLEAADDSDPVVDRAQIAISEWSSRRAPTRCGSLMAAERCLVILGGRLVILAVNEHRSSRAGRFAGPGGGVSGESALLDAPLRPLRQQPECRVGIVGKVALADQVRRHLDAVRRASVERALVRTLMRSPLGKDGARGRGHRLGDVLVPCRVPVQERIIHMAAIERGEPTSASADPVRSRARRRSR